MLAVVDFFLVADLAYVGDVCEQLEQRAFIKVPPATLLALRVMLRLLVHSRRSISFSVETIEPTSRKSSKMARTHAD